MKDCPVDRCDARIRSEMLMCRHHWYGVPKTLRDEVWRTYRGGEGVYDQAYVDAAAAAIEYIEVRAA